MTELERLEPVVHGDLILDPDGTWAATRFEGKWVVPLIRFDGSEHGGHVYRGIASDFDLGDVPSFEFYTDEIFKSVGSYFDGLRRWTT